MKVYLENCEGFSFINGEPAYCSNCSAGINYSTNKIPKQCGNCNGIIKENNFVNPKGLYLICKDGNIDE